MVEDLDQEGLEDAGDLHRKVVMDPNLMFIGLDRAHLRDLHHLCPHHGDLGVGIEVGRISRSLQDQDRDQDHPSQKGELEVVMTNADLDVAAAVR